MGFSVGNGDFYLASASQDGCVRLWKFSKNPPEGKPAKKVLKIKEIQYFIEVESILYGHEGWVYSASWSPDSLKLLTASFDKTMIIWELDTDTGLWLENIRVGEVSSS